MIFVDRNIVNPQVLNALNARFLNDNLTELERAINYYNIIPFPKKAYKFTRYKAQEVCQALDEIYHQKCAYCESSYRALDARDVEHYRPKGGVKECKGHPGYWWLAADWDNLLPSCPPCNQYRHQYLYKEGLSWEDLERIHIIQPKVGVGKANSFPVKNQKWATKREENYKKEIPLLINPSFRNPDDHLEWVFDWNKEFRIWEESKIAALVRPKLKRNKEDEFGKASIAIYGLNRVGLVRERMAHLNTIQMICAPVIDVISDLSHNLTSGRKHQLIERLKEYKTRLYCYTHSDKVYSGMVRSYIVLFEKQLTMI